MVITMNWLCIPPVKLLLKYLIIYQILAGYNKVLIWGNVYGIDKKLKLIEKI